MTITPARLKATRSRRAHSELPIVSFLANGVPGSAAETRTSQGVMVA